MAAQASLPRGVHASQTHGAALATARWGSAEELAPWRYKDGDIYLGITRAPNAVARSLIARISNFLQEMSLDTEVQDPDWKQRHGDKLRSYLGFLSMVERVPIGINDDRHHILTAGSRSGKGVSVIIANLLLYSGSVFTIDPKGANARLAAARRGKGSKHCKGLDQKVFVLDPLNVSKVERSLIASFNPLDELDPNAEEVIDKAASIADALIMRQSTGDGRYFDESARIFVKGLILFVALNADPEDRHLAFVHRLALLGVRGTKFELPPDLASDPPNSFRDLLRLMSEEFRLEGIVAGIASTLLDAGDREYGAILSTLRSNLEFLERPGIRRTLRTSSFRMSDLKSDPQGISVFLCLPVSRFADCSRFLRLLTACALEAIYADPAPPRSGRPVLMLLEEFAALGHMAPIETTAGYAAEFGVKLMIVTQDLPQLRRNYEKGYETFIANAGVIQSFGNGDTTTLEYLSKKLGETEIVRTTMSQTHSLSASSNDPSEFNLSASLIPSRGIMSVATPLLAGLDQQAKGQSATSTTSGTEQIQKTPLLLPDEIERIFARERMNQLVLIKGERPFVLERETYYGAPEFAGLYEPDRAPYRTLAEAEQWKAGQLQQTQARTAALIAEAEAYLVEVESTLKAAKASSGKPRSFFRR